MEFRESPLDIEWNYARRVISAIKTGGDVGEISSLYRDYQRQVLEAVRSHASYNNTLFKHVKGMFFDYREKLLNNHPPDN
ncbi:MAG: hypothetical protein M1165_02805 [Candidatus Pacearchaeota archaeon]|nr:hypothetical protein [Candidatus Pacearchaeota archaeon]